MFASFLALALPPASVADPFVDAAAVIVCPPAPNGFYLPAGDAGRFVLSPLSTMNESPGGTSVQVSCKYFTHGTGEMVMVAVRYALPQNFNPYADFDIGCKSDTMGVGSPTGPVPWDTPAGSTA